MCKLNRKGSVLRLLSMGDMSKTPPAPPTQWMPETANSATPYIYLCSYLDMHTLIKCNLHVWHSKRLAVARNKIEQLNNTL